MSNARANMEAIASILSQFPKAMIRMTTDMADFINGVSAPYHLHVGHSAWCERSSGDGPCSCTPEITVDRIRTNAN